MPQNNKIKVLYEAKDASVDAFSPIRQGWNDIVFGRGWCREYELFRRHEQENYERGRLWVCEVKNLGMAPAPWTALTFEGLAAQQVSRAVLAMGVEGLVPNAPGTTVVRTMEQASAALKAA